MKILVVDDEKDIKTLFEQRFRKEIKSAEMEFVFAYSGDEALGYMNQHVHEAVLILSDINMPGMSGLDLQTELNQTDFQMPIIFISGHADVPMSVRAIKAGAVEFLVKPFREQELFGFVVSGLMNKQIAGEMGISLITVKVHRGNVMQKMRAKSLAELVRMADALGVAKVKA